MVFPTWLRSLNRRFQHVPSQRIPRRLARKKAANIELRLEELEDRTLLSPYIVNTTAASGSGSLFDAISQVNADTSHALYTSSSNPSVDEIDFNIPTTDPGYSSSAGTFTIQPASPGLPTIATSVIIDGYTQPGYAGSPLIVLNGSQAGAAANGLTVTAGNSTIWGLDIGGFSGQGIVVKTNGGNTIQGDYIGVNAAGTGAMANVGVGILIKNSDNTIGGLTPTPGTGAGNIISGNEDDGVECQNATSTGNVIEGNLIGTDLNNDTNLGNFAGVQIQQSASGNTVEGNVISGNLHDGVRLGSGANSPDAAANVVEGNYIGTNAAGKGVVANGNYGVDINNGQDNLIGGTSPAARNVISGNSSGGVQITHSASANVVEGNYIGTDYAGGTNLGNSAGVAINGGAQKNTIGGTTSGAGNLISGNVSDGVDITQIGTSNNRLFRKLKSHLEFESMWSMAKSQIV